MYNIRKQIFFIIDKLKNSAIKNNLVDIEDKINNNYTSDIQSILSHSISTTKFYNKKYDSQDITTFPVINKTMMKKNLSDFLSHSFEKKALIKVVTSGSTGTPFTSYQDKNKKHRNTADTIFFGELANYNFGNKLFYLKIWSENNKKSNLLQKMQNIIPIDVFHLNETAELLIEDLNKEKDDINMLGYVSAFETVAQWIEEHNIKVEANINSIITMSESLSQESRKLISKTFKTNAFSRYSNIENGILAQQIPGSKNDFIINNASYFIEILDINSDKVLPDGRLGRIIVTDLYNKGMPFIRYDTGDLGVKSKRGINGHDYEVFSHIEGRKLDQIFDTKGELVSSYIVYKNMWQYPEINQYQLIQETKNEYSIKINIHDKFEKENILINQFKDYLGKDAIITVEYVDEIPLLESGKRKKVINLMTANPS